MIFPALSMDKTVAKKGLDLLEEGLSKDFSRKTPAAITGSLD